MTNSVTKTNQTESTGDHAVNNNNLVWPALTGGAVLGLLVILQLHNWHFGTPVFFLWMGWLGIELMGLFLWRTAWEATEERLDERHFWEPVGPFAELEQEKRALIKAIKELEFDREMASSTKMMPTI